MDRWEKLLCELGLLVDVRFVKILGVLGILYLMGQGVIRLIAYLILLMR